MRAAADQCFAFGMIDDDVAGAQLFRVVVRAADGDFARRVEAVPAGGIAARHPRRGDFDQLVAEDRDDPRERTDPACAFAAERGGAPAHRLGPGERPHDRGDRPGQHLVGRASGAFDRRKPGSAAILEPVGAEPGLFAKPLDRLRRRADLGALEFFAHRLRRLRQVAHDQREAARGRPDRNRAVRDPGGLQIGAKQRLELGPRTRLHPRGDFLAAQFEEEIDHVAVHPGNLAVHPACCWSIHAAQLPLARSRTRPM